MIKLSLYETFNNYINHVDNKIPPNLTTYNDDFKPTNIYFIRHGHSCSNLLKEKLKLKNTNQNPKDYADYKIKSKSLTNKFISSLAKKHTLITNPNLSGLGLLQAQELNSSVSAIFNGNNNNQLIVFCSPLVRAMETAQIAFPNRTISYEYYYYFNNDANSKLPNLETNKIYILPFIKELGITPDNALPNIENSNQKFVNFMNKYKNTATDKHNYNTYVFVNHKQEAKVKKIKLLTKKIKTFFSRTKKKPSSSSNKNTSPLLTTQKGKFLSFLKKVNTSDISNKYKLIFVSHSNFIKSIVGKENITTSNNKIKNTMIIDIHGNNYSNKITDNSENEYMTCMSDTNRAESEIASASAPNQNELAKNPLVNNGSTDAYNAGNEEYELVEQPTKLLRKRKLSEAKLTSSASRKSQPKIPPLKPQSSLRTNSNATSSVSSSASASSSQSVSSSNAPSSATSYASSQSTSSQPPQIPLTTIPPPPLTATTQSPPPLLPSPSVTKSSASSRASSRASPQLVTPPPSVTKSSASSRASSREPLNNNKLKTNINSLFKTKRGQPNKINNVSIELGSDELILKYGGESKTIKYDKLSILNPMSKYIIKRHIGSHPDTATFVNNINNMIAKSKIFYKVLKYLKDKNGGTRKQLRIKNKKTKKL
jgi:hypothetical protein